MAISRHQSFCLFGQSWAGFADASTASSIASRVQQEIASQPAARSTRTDDKGKRDSFENSKLPPSFPKNYGRSWPLPARHTRIRHTAFFFGCVLLWHHHGRAEYQNPLIYFAHPSRKRCSSPPYLTHFLAFSRDRTDTGCRASAPPRNTLYSNPEDGGFAISNDGRTPGVLDNDAEGDAEGDSQFVAT